MATSLFPQGSLRAAVADLAGDFLKALVSHQVRRMTLGPTPIKVSPDVRRSRGESPPDDDVACPYCAVARQLAAAYRYMKRAEKSPNFGEDYQELAHRHIVGAGQTLTSLPNLSAPKNAGLLHQLANLEDDLSRSHSQRDYSGLAAMIWEASDKALDLAEEYQEDARVIDTEVRELDNEVYHEKP